MAVAALIVAAAAVAAAAVTVATIAVVVVFPSFANLVGAICQLLNILFRQHPQHDHAIHALFEPLFGLVECLRVDEAAVDLRPAGARRDVLALLRVLGWRNALTDGIWVFWELVRGFAENALDGRRGVSGWRDDTNTVTVTVGGGFNEGKGVGLLDNASVEHAVGALFVSRSRGILISDVLGPGRLRRLWRETSTVPLSCKITIIATTLVALSFSASSTLFSFRVAGVMFT